jgi:hypothetical protein
MVDTRQILIFGAVGLVALVMLVSGRNIIQDTVPGESITGNAVLDPTIVGSEMQSVTLKMVNYGYELEPSTFKKGVPVRMEVDLSTVYGCMRDVRIPAFGVSKYVREGDNVIEFTPTKSGTFNIACSMNMGRGSFSVEEGDGQVAAYVEPEPIAEAGSCGSGAGGCGCGS